MSALAVRISDGYTDRHVTRYTSGLRFRKTVPGGHADASCTLAVPAGTFTDLGPIDRMWVYDTNTAATVWEGYTNNPGKRSGRDGQGLDLSALGGASLASLRREKLIYIDWSMDRWRRADNLATLIASSTTEAVEDPAVGEPALRAQFVPGTPITSGSRASFIYDAFKGSTQVGSGIGARIRGGIIDSNYRTDIGTPGEFILQRNLTTSAATLLFALGTDWFTGASIFYLHLTRATGGATTPSTDVFWGAFAQVRVLGDRMDRNGTDQPIANWTYVLASEVVEDLLGRVLTFCDPATSFVETTGFGIDQLAYHDATSAAAVFDDLMLTHPNMIWEILESNGNGKHRFNWRSWPTSARYVIPPSIPVEQPGSDQDLCNRIAVNYTDPKGNPQVLPVGSYVPELGNKSPVLLGGDLDPTFVGQIRDAEAVTLPSGVGSAFVAERIGEQILATKATQPRAARAVIDRPIVDLARGQMVQPWEIEPGYVARVAATGDDLRLTEMEYDHGPCTATLTLGDPVRTVEQRLARLARVK